MSQLMHEQFTQVSILDFIRYSITQFEKANLFYGHGTDNARDEAYYLILSALHMPVEQADAFLQAKLTQAECTHLQTLLNKRIDKRIPTAYLVNQAWFADLPFYVDERVIIPRSPMAELIERGFMPWIDTHDIHRVLDLCTGSGCIAIAVASYLQGVLVDAVDLSEAALAVASINIEKHHLQDNIQLIKSNLFNDVHARYDVIISNPPYVDAAAMQTLPEEFLQEPSLALAAGQDGLDLVRTILRQASNYLTEHGILLVEVGASQEAFERAFPTLPVTWVEFERGGQGVFVIRAVDLINSQSLG